MSKQEKYDAFISYRHCLPDSEIALGLQKKLESFRLPKDIAGKTGKSNLKSVFLDQTELSVADDLSGELSAALLNSDYLIAICSPEYLKSQWCMREIRTFLDFKGRKKILLVLADGEPENAFPEVLLYENVFSSDAYGNVTKSRVYKEPLAADCRGATSKERKEKIARQNEIITLKYSDTLAATSDNLLRDGKRTDAVYSARLALPDEKTDNYSELATKALVNALGIYDLPNTFGCDNDVLLPSSVLDDLAVSSNGRYASVKDLDHIRYVVDMNSGAVVLSFEENEGAGFVFDGEKGFVFKRQENNYSYFDLATGTETDLGIIEAYLDSDTEDEGYVIRSGDDITLYNGTNALWSINVLDEGFPEAARLEITVTFTNDTSECWIFIVDYDKQTTSAFTVDMMSGSSRRMLIANRACSDVVTDGKSIAWTQSEDNAYSLWIRDIVDGTTNSTTVGYVYGTAVMNDDVVVLSEGAIKILNKRLEEVDRLDAGQLTRTYVSGDAIYLVDSDCRLILIRNGVYDRRNGYYYISSMNVDVYDGNFKNIYSICDCMLTGIDNQSGAIVVYNVHNDHTGNKSVYYKACPVTYEQLISLADEFLSGYEPDERVKEKYSLG